MDKTIKARRLDKLTADAATDIGLINQHSLKELTPEDVFAFSVILCDNEIDRDLEVFTDSCLEKLAPLFVGKTGIFNHSWSAHDQVARIYAVAVEDGEGVTKYGSQKRQLRALAYIPRNEFTAEVIAKIESGILKEVSVGLSVSVRTCSVCGAKMYGSECDEGHKRGAEIDGKVCHARLDEPTDAFEWSFVAVPAQPAAGITKSYADIDGALAVVLGCDLSGKPDVLSLLSTKLAESKQSAAEKQKRLAILQENNKFLRKED